MRVHSGAKEKARGERREKKAGVRIQASADCATADSILQSIEEARPDNHSYDYLHSYEAVLHLLAVLPCHD